MKLIVSAFLSLFVVYSSNICLVPQTRGESPSYRSFTELRQKLDPGARCLFDDTKGHCINISGRLSLPQPSGLQFDKRKIVENFLALHGKILNITNLSSNFKFLNEATRKEKGPTFFKYRQIVKNGDASIPVYGAAMTVAINNEGVVTSVDTTHRADLPKDIPLTPKISHEEAMKIINEDLAEAVQFTSDKGLQILSKTIERDWSLVWIFEAQEKKGQHAIFEYIISAQTGDIISKKDMIKYAPDCQLMDVGWAGYDMIPVCKDEDNYWIYTNLPKDESRYEIHNGDHEDSGGVVTFPIDTWPPPITDYSHAVIIAQWNIGDYLNYLQDNLYQKSWCGDNVSDCPIMLYSLNQYEKVTNAHWHGAGIIDLSGNPDKEVVAHEIGHGVWSAYGDGVLCGCCDEVNPECPGIDEGWTQMIAMLYNFTIETQKNFKFFSEVKDDYPTRYHTLIEEIKAKNNWECGAYAFGYGLMKSIIGRMLYGMPNNDPSPFDPDLNPFVYVDANHLFDRHQAEWLFMETVRTKQNYRYDMIGFSTAMLSTCKDYIDSVYTEDECMNLERVFRSLAIYPGDGYDNLHAMGPHTITSPIPMDISMNAPNFQIKELDSYLNNEITTGWIAMQRYNVDLLLSGGFKVDNVPEKFLYTFPWKVHIDLKAGDNYVGRITSVNKNNTGWTAKKVRLHISTAIETPSKDENSDILYFPFVDYIREISVGLDFTGQDFFDYFKDVHNDNNMITFKFGPNFNLYFDYIKVAPKDEQPECTISLVDKLQQKLPSTWRQNKCPQKYIITLMAKNTGNKPTYPVLWSGLLGPNYDSIKFERYIEELSKHNEYKSVKNLKELQDDELITDWKKNNGDNQTPDDCAPKYPAVIEPGSSFCVKQFEITATPDQFDDEYVAVIKSPIPELSTSDNIRVFTIGWLLTILGGVPDECLHLTPQECIAHKMRKQQMAEMHDFMVHLAENKDALRTLTDGELMTMPPHDPVFDDILFNPGERIILPPDENGHYSEDAIPSPQELLKQLFEDPARLGGLEPPTLGSEDRYSIH